MQRYVLCDKYLSYEDDKYLRTLYSLDVTKDAVLSGGRQIGEAMGNTCDRSLSAQILRNQ